MHDQLTEGRQERVHDRAVRRTAEVPESLRPAWIAHDSEGRPAIWLPDATPGPFPSPGIIARYDDYHAAIWDALVDLIADHEPPPWVVPPQAGDDHGE